MSAGCVVGRQPAPLQRDGTYGLTSESPTGRMDRILRFWHQVEFFIPYDLQQQVLESNNADWAVRMLSRRMLESARQSLWRPFIPAGREITGFAVYIGLFDKSLLSEITRKVVNEDLPPAEKFEEEQRAELEGATCIAMIQADAKGRSLLNAISVSTAPWALGHIQAWGLSQLDFEHFKFDVEQLKEKLTHFRAECQPEDHGFYNSAGVQNDGSSNVAPLSAQDLLRLLEIFEEWAAFRPSGYAALGDPLIAIRTFSRKKRQPEETDPRPKTADSQRPPPFSRNGSGENDDDEADDEAEAGDGDVQVDILNSFFATDIAKVIDSLRDGIISPALYEYLNPLAHENRLDLYRPEGWEQVRQKLAPELLNRGHWPGEPSHRMYLMQQFAINSMLQKLEAGGLFSVNGPPGTGKTTLLRDMFADIVTRRAKVLAGLATARQAFTAQALHVEFIQDKPCKVSCLRADLTGFEIMVASSNNTAVENISKDIPKAKSLGETAWRDGQGAPKAGYLQTVAHNVAARKPGGDYARLEKDDIPWGLTACVLGNRSNRRKFAFGLCGNVSKDKAPPEGYDSSLHQSIWAWRGKYGGPSFQEAQHVFTAAEKAVTHRLLKLQAHAGLAMRLGGKDRDAYCAEKMGMLERAQSALDAARKELERGESGLAWCEKQLASLREETGLIRQRYPAKWVLWFLRKRRRRLEAEISAVHQQLQSWLRKQRDGYLEQQQLQEKAAAAVLARTQAQQDLEAAESQWQEIYDAWAQSAKDFPDAKCPASADELEKDGWQISGLWHDATLNQLRSELFVAALSLHEAWLAEVLKPNGGFGGNLVALERLLSGKRLQRPEHALALWQSLFMVVPVVSSTFASIANQFRELGPQSLGWLFIDEAGQAVPQAAVGALWRTRRAVVVGDPLQIEPVFTVPIRLIEMLARWGSLAPASGVEPHRFSVQTLADGANHLGAWMEMNSQPQWIGSPLRVHRRCVDPMFSIANSIAYQGKMVFFDPDQPVPRVPPANSLDLGPSCWIKMGGKAEDKQVVPDQIEFACKVVMALYARNLQLPPLYIISPFRRIKQALSMKLKDKANWPSGKPVPKVRDLREWCNDHIGTVHTFQGKEESAVLMVLGCDSATENAAAWAAGKPNLLNVALTRAKHRFFMLGDEKIWSKLPYFSEAHAECLPRVEPAEFLAALDMARSAS